MIYFTINSGLKETDVSKDTLTSTINIFPNPTFNLLNIELNTKVDESLIGGFVLEFNNNLVDASIARDLRDVKKQFAKNVFVANLR